MSKPMPNGMPTPAPIFEPRSLDEAGAVVVGPLVAAAFVVSGWAIAIMVL